MLAACASRISRPPCARVMPATVLDACAFNEIPALCCVMRRVIAIDVADGPASDRLGIGLVELRAANTRWWRWVSDASYQGVRGARPAIVPCGVLHVLRASGISVSPCAVIMPASEPCSASRDEAVTGSRVVRRVGTTNVANCPPTVGLNDGLVELATARVLSITRRLARRWTWCRRINRIDADDQLVTSAAPAVVLGRMLHVGSASHISVPIVTIVVPTTVTRCRVRH